MSVVPSDLTVSERNTLVALAATCLPFPRSAKPWDVAMLTERDGWDEFESLCGLVLKDLVERVPNPNWSGPEDERHNESNGHLYSPTALGYFVVLS